MVKTDKNDNINKKSNINFIGYGAFAFVVVAWLITFISFDYPFFDIRIKPNEFGDMFGGLNALFTGLAFAGIIVTILLQREDLKSQQAVLNLQLEQLKLQKKELADTRKVLETQQKEMAQQNKTLKLQQFENTLFSMIDNFNGIVEFIDYHNSTRGITLNGRAAISRIIASTSRSVINKPVEDIVNWFKLFDVQFGPYFRTLYNILKFIDFSKVEDKELYIHILRDQLSEDEIYLLGLFGMRTDNNKKFKQIIEKYCLLRLLDIELERNKNICDYYSPEAFSNSTP